MIALVLEDGESQAEVGHYSAHGVNDLHAATGIGMPVSGDAHQRAAARKQAGPAVTFLEDYRATLSAHTATVLAGGDLSTLEAPC